MIIASTSTDVDFLAVFVGLFGGLSLFLFGMEQMTESLKAAAGGRMRDLLGKLTTNRWTGALTGAFVTAIIQSSSVTTVLVVGFTSAGIMSLTQSVGVIVGANVGTTITAQVIAFKVTQFALPTITVGFSLLFFSRRELVRRVGAMLMGLGLIFFGMGLMSGATDPLRSYEPFTSLMESIRNPLLGIAIGAVFTAVVQSSSATTGIVIVLAAQGLISLEAGIGLALGANVGTSVTAVLAALGRGRPAMRAATVHVLFNVLGSLLWMGFVGGLADLVRLMAHDTARQIANAHTIFNVANALLFLPFTGGIAHLVTKLVPEKLDPDVERARARYLQDVYLETPAIAISRLRMEIGRLGEFVSETVSCAAPLDLECVGEAVGDVDSLYAEIVNYSRRLASRDITLEDSRNLELLLSVTTYQQSIADTVHYNIRELEKEWRSRQLRTSDETHRMFLELHQLIAGTVTASGRAIRDMNPELATEIVSMKPRIMGLADRLARRLGERLRSDEPNRLDIFRLENQAIEVMKRIYYFSKRIAKTVAASAEEEEVPAVAAG